MSSAKWWPFCVGINALTHWGPVTHICVSDLTIIGSDNGLSPGRRQVIMRTNTEILLIRPLGTNFSEILIEILLLSFKKMRLKVSSAKRQPFCLDLNALRSPASTIGLLVGLDILKPDRMAAFSKTTFQNSFYSYGNCCIFIQVSLEFVELSIRHHWLR